MWPWASNCAHVSLSLKEGHLYVLFIPFVGISTYLPQIHSGSALPLSVPQDADLWSLHHLGPLAGWFPAALGQWKFRLAGNQMVVGVGIFFLLSPSAPLVRTVSEGGHSSPAPTLTRHSPLLSSREGSNGKPLLFSPGFSPDLVVPLTLTTFLSSSFIPVSSFEISGVNHVACQDPDWYSL